MKKNYIGKIVLIGFRGTGKSTVGKKLALLLGMKYLSIDDLIRKEFKLSVNEIVEKYDWSLFRKKESEIIKSLRSRKNVIIDTGGGSILKSINRMNLKHGATVIQLTAHKKDIYQRIIAGEDRPALTSIVSLKKEISDVIESRKELYNSISDITINTSKNDIKQTVTTILKHIKGLV